MHARVLIIAGGALKQRNLPCNEASLQHLAWRSPVTGCTAAKQIADKDFDLCQKPRDPQLAAMNCLRTVNPEWSFCHQQAQGRRGAISRYPEDLDSIPLQAAMQAGTPLPSARMAHHTSPRWLRKDLDGTPAVSQRAAAERNDMPAVFSAASRGNVPSRKDGAGPMYHGKEQTASEHSLPQSCEQTGDRPFQRTAAVNLPRHLGTKCQPSSEAHVAISSAVGKVDNAITSLHGIGRRYSELPLQTTAAVAKHAMPALGRPQTKEQSSILRNCRSHSTGQPGYVNIVADATAPASVKGTSAAAILAFAASEKQPALYRAAYGTCGSPRSAQAAVPAVHRTGDNGNSSFPTQAASTASKAAPWAETLRNKLRQLRAHRGISPIFSGSKPGKLQQVSG